VSSSRGYPRPQLRRAEWTPLDGEWDFALDREARWSGPEEVVWGPPICVPFAPEAPRSGIGETGFFLACWYRRRFDPPPIADGARLLLHFGAVDYEATVSVNDALAGHHFGGYTPFTIDLTPFLRHGRPQEIVVGVRDDPADLAKPRGKQDWQREPHAIWYPRTTGIWQTVWLERVPRTSITRLRWTPSLERWELGFEVWLTGCTRGMELRLTLAVGTHVLARDTYAVVRDEVHRKVALSDPGIDDSRNALLWSPASPTLIAAEIELRDETGTVVDTVRSYAGLRSIAVQGDVIVLNGRPYRLRMVLDQGYWPDTGLTPPDDASERHYVQALYHLTRTIDPTRPVVGNDGWESVATDIIGIHDYDEPERLRRRYTTDELRSRLFQRERPGGRLLVLGDVRHPPHPVVLSEFGGIACSPDPDRTWGYARCPSPEALATRYRELMEVVHGLEMLAGFCYTQFADTYQEANGLLYADRTPKFPLEQIRDATRGLVRRPTLESLGPGLPV